MIDPGSRVYFDSNITIYLLERTPDWFECAKAFFIDANEAGAQLVTSELTIGECLVHPHRFKDELLLQAYERFFADEAIQKEPVDLGILKSAAELAGVARLRLNDAIHVATAVAENCDVFVTNDARIRAIEGLRVLLLKNFSAGPHEG